MEEYIGNPEIKKMAATTFATAIDNLVTQGTPIFKREKDGKEIFSDQMTGPAIMLRMAGIKNQEIIDFAKAIEFAARTLKPHNKDLTNMTTDDIGARRLENLNKFISDNDDIFNKIRTDYINAHTKKD